MLDLPQTNPTVPSGNGPHTPIGAMRILSCSLKMGSWVETKSNSVLPLVVAWRSVTRHVPESKTTGCCCLENSCWSLGHWSLCPPSPFPEVEVVCRLHYIWIYTDWPNVPLPHRGQSLLGRCFGLFCCLFRHSRQVCPGLSQLKHLTSPFISAVSNVARWCSVPTSWQALIN